MAYELTLTLGNTAATVFLQDGFYTLDTLSQNLHRHTYTEFHAISGGEVQFLIGKEIYQFQDGDIFAIPPNTLHMCLSYAEGVRHTAFQTDAIVPSFTWYNSRPGLMDAFMDAILICSKNPDHTKVAAFISLLCGDFYPDRRIHIQGSQDLAFLIHEFFSHNYREDVSLSDLAQQLHFSEKHTARLVLKYTDRTFTQALTSQRMTIARHLAATTDMSLGEIACYVGYRSYSGFWKAYKKSSHP